MPGVAVPFDVTKSTVTGVDAAADKATLNTNWVVPAFPSGWRTSATESVGGGGACADASIGSRNINEPHTDIVSGLVTRLLSIIWFSWVPCLPPGPSSRTEYAEGACGRSSRPVDRDRHRGPLDVRGGQPAGPDRQLASAGYRRAAVPPRRGTLRRRRCEGLPA